MQCLRTTFPYVFPAADRLAVRRLRVYRQTTVRVIRNAGPAFAEKAGNPDPRSVFAGELPPFRSGKLP